MQETLSQNLQALLLASLDEAVIATDPGGTIILWNLEAEKLYGYPAQEAVGRPIADLIVSTLNPEQAGGIMDRLSAGEAWRGVFDVTRKDGVNFKAEVRNVPVLNAEGNLEAVLGLYRNVSPQFELDAEHERVIAELEAANRAKDEFLGLISHELRTPLTTILGFAELVTRYENELSREMLHESLIDIRDAARRMHRTVHDLLALGRLEVQGEVELEPVALVPVIESVATQHRDQNPGRVLQVQAPPALPRVRARSSYMEHVFENLLSNAEKYSPIEHPIDITVAEGPDRVIVTVMDRGAGISESLRTQIFEPFFRAAEAESTFGAGLGLTVCRRLMQLQRGEIWMEPRPGGGSCFNVALTIANR